MDSSLLQSLMGLAGAGVVVALVELVKKSWPELEARWYPVASLACGIALNLALAYLMGTRADYAALLGVLAGLAASGLFSSTKAAIIEPNRRASIDEERARLAERG